MGGATCSRSSTQSHSVLATMYDVYALSRFGVLESSRIAKRAYGSLSTGEIRAWAPCAEPILESFVVVFY